MKSPVRLLGGARIHAVLCIALALPLTVPASEQPLRTLSAIPREALSTRTAFVLAAGGSSYFFNPSLGIIKAPFLAGVYKPFGFSPDGRGFLYLKSQGRLPGFTLYLYDLIDGTERQIAPGRVFHAAFSPDGSRIAYFAFDTLTEADLLVQPVAAGPVQRIDSGRMALDFLEWSHDGSKLAFRRITPIGENYAEDGTYHHTLAEYDFATGALDRHEGALWGRYEKGRLVYWKDGGLMAGGKRDNRLAAAASVEGTSIEGFVTGARDTFVTRVAAGVPRVEKLEPGGGREIARGAIHLATNDGFVIREFTGSGVRYSYVDFATEAASELFLFTGQYRMPMAGSASINQGGVLYTAGTCDGANCGITSHRTQLGFALDFQQRVGLNQGNENVLAVEDGVVLAAVNNITCNSTSTTCPDFRSGCPTNGGSGNSVILAHPDGTFTSYSHLAFNSISVTVNQAVCRGTKLAVQGHSGTTAPGGYMNCDNHLHFQRIRVLNGVDPFSQSIPTDFEDMPCTLACGGVYGSRNEETPASCVSVPPTVITTNPPGLNLRVDGATVVAPQTYGWPVGESHTVVPISPQGSSDSRHVFLGWNDGGPATRTIAGHSTNTISTFTANFQRQFLLDAAVEPPGSGTVTTRPAAADNYFTQGARIQLVAVPAPGFQFTAWTGDVNTAQPEPFITMSAKRAVTAIFVPAPAVNTGGVVNGADFSPVLVRGAIFSIFGRNLAPATITVSEIPLPVRVADTIVEIREPGRIQSAPLYFISPGQINAQMPPDVTSPVVDIIIRTPAGITTVTNVPVLAAAPRVFARAIGGRSEAIVVRGNYTLVTSDAPATGGEAAFLYVNGLGMVAPVKAKGEPGGDGGVLGPLNLVVERVRVFVGGFEVEAAFAGLAPGLVGVYQVNFEFPRLLDTGNRSIVIRVGDQDSQPGVTVPYLATP